MVFGNARFAALFCALAGALLLSGCASQPPPEGKLVVVASFYPLYDFARNVGGDRIEASVLIPPGVEPHEYELTPSDARALASADVFVYNGAGLEPWVPELLEGIGNAGLVAVDSSAGIALISSQDPDEPGTDPHVWLDPVLAKKQVEAIRDALVAADPEGVSYYEANAAAYMGKLEVLDSEFRSVMSSCRKRDVLITHATLAYFCAEYGCRQIPIEGINPEAEPLPSDIARIVQQARRDNVTTVFVEEMISPRAAEAIAGEINGSVAVFNSVHGLTQEQQAQGEDYVSLMRENEEVIKNALECNQ
jgi:zinc transport system substrate-binding protein